MRLAHLGKKFSEETRAKLSKALTGIRRTEEFKEKARLSHKGQKRSKESIKK